MQWFSNLNALPKLVLSFGLLTLLNVMTGVLALNRLNEESERVVTAYSSDIEGMAQVDTIASAKLGLARLTRDAIIKIDNKEAVAQDTAAFAALAAATEKNIGQSQISFRGQEGSAQIEEIRVSFPRYLELSRAILARVQSGDATGAVAALAEVEPIAKTLNADTADAAAAKRRRAARTSAVSQEGFRNSRVLLIGLIAACACVGVGMSWWIGSLFSRPLGQAVALLKRVSKGDLTGNLDLHTRDEVGVMAAALNEAFERMRATLHEVSAASNGVSVALDELSSSSDAIARGAHQQAASLEETSASMEEITATVRQTADNAGEATLLASSSRVMAEKGGHIVSDAVTAMSEINAASVRISDIISTVNEIAFQTNLLAVNAAVEAARAGEQGRGFAVVASEVRSLALRSAASAKEIKALIGDSLGKVEKGTALVNRSGETLQSIIQSVKRVSEIVDEIAIASKEQSSGIEQVNLAMSQMDGVTQTNSAQTKDLAETALSLSGQSSTLMELVNRFKIDRSAGSGAPVSRPLVKIPAVKALRGTPVGVRTAATRGSGVALSHR